MKLILIPVPDNTSDNDIQSLLQEMMSKLGIVTNVTILNQESLTNGTNYNDKTKLMRIVDDIIVLCGSPKDPKLGEQMFFCKFWNNVFQLNTFSREILEVLGGKLTKAEMYYIENAGMVNLRNAVIKFLKMAP